MAYVICDRTTKLIRVYESFPDSPFDPAAEVRFFIDRIPDQLTERWDNAAGLRPATSAELIAAADARLNAEAIAGIDGMKMLKAVVIWLAPLVGKTPAQARAEIIVVYKTLP